MFKIFVAVFLFFLLPAGFSWSQTPSGKSKVFTGQLHTTGLGPGKIAPQGKCTLEFDSPVLITEQPAIQIPSELTYSVKFEGTSFNRFIINIQTNDKQDFPIDPASDITPPDPEGKHHIFDPYLIYLILSPDKIERIELQDPAGNTAKYVLDKSEIL